MYIGRAAGEKRYMYLVRAADVLLNYPQHIKEKLEGINPGTSTVAMVHTQRAPYPSNHPSKKLLRLCHPPLSNLLRHAPHHPWHSKVLHSLSFSTESSTLLVSYILSTSCLSFCEKMYFWSFASSPSFSFRGSWERGS